jgi:hypothetical protein
MGIYTHPNWLTTENEEIATTRKFLYTAFW